MRIKLKKKAQWEGVQHNAGSVHDLDTALAEKLIARGYAELHIPTEGSDPVIPTEVADAAAAE